MLSSNLQMWQTGAITISRTQFCLAVGTQIIMALFHLEADELKLQSNLALEEARTNLDRLELCDGDTFMGVTAEVERDNQPPDKLRCGRRRCIFLIDSIYLILNDVSKGLVIKLKTFSRSLRFISKCIKCCLFLL